MKRSIAQYMDELIRKNKIVRLTETKILDSTHVSHINLMLDYADLHVYTHDEGNMTLTLHTYEDGPTLQRQNKETYIDIVIKSKNNKKSFFHTYPTVRLEIKVPEKTAFQWCIEARAGDLNMTDVTFQTLNVKASAGDLSLNRIKAGKLAITCNSGDIKVADLVGESLQLYTNSGDLHLQNITARMMTCSAGSGDITGLNVVVQMLNIKVTSGDINFDTAAQHVTAEANSGDVMLKMPKLGEMNDLMTRSGRLALYVVEEVNANIDITVTSGSVITNLPIKLVKNNMRSYYKGKSGDGRSNVRLSATSGDIILQTRKNISI